MNKEENFENEYKKAAHERQKHIDLILDSKSDKKIIVAGPGTGKTYLFQEVLKSKKKSLTLTFINSLVEDLSLELYGLSDVKTLHSFARSELGKAIKGGVKVFSKLSEVIKDDSKILLGREIDFDPLFHNKEDENEDIEFYKKRKKYYDNHYGYSDIIYALVKHFEKRNDRIPIYEQVVVDEFQDFNNLEVALIDQLAEKSPILLTGDDDQALYEKLKSASAEFIRQRYHNANLNFTPFSLPFCSRCTQVIVDAVNDIIDAAYAAGYFSKRIKKEYEYFREEEKDKESKENPKVIYSQLFDKQIPWFIEQCISEIAEAVRAKFSVLIISPIKLQSRSIIQSLKGKGFRNIESTGKRDEKDLTLLDGLKILIADERSNLGWRIAAKFLLKEKDFRIVLRETNKEDPKNILDIITKKLKKEIKELLKIIRKVRDDKEIEKNKFDDFLKKIKFEPADVAREYIKDEIIYGSQIFGNPSLRKIPIKATTIQSSKGLSADYVFITHFDDQYFIKNKEKKKISDQDICNFLVALTRARRKVFLISSNKKEPTFLKWIHPNRIEKK